MLFRNLFNRITIFSILLNLFFYLPKGRAEERNEEIILSLRECIEIALKNNLQLKIERLNPLGASYSIISAKGYFDPILEASTNYGKYNFTQGDYLSEQQVIEYSLGVSQRLWTGTTYQIILSSAINKYKGPYIDNMKEYNTSLSLGISQSILKNFGVDINKAKINIASNNFNISKEELMNQISELVFKVINAYWGLVLNKGNLEVARQSLEFAKSLKSNIEKQVKIGLLPSIEILVAETQVALREETVIKAEQNVKDAEDLLKQLINIDNGKVGNKLVTPLDTPTSEKKNFSLEECLEKSLKNRFELKEAFLNIKNKEISSNLAKNQSLPDLKLQGGIKFTGSVTKPINSSTSDTNYWDSYSKLGETISYDVGVSVEYPIGNRIANGDMRLSYIELEKSKIYLESLKQEVFLEVRKGIRDIETSLKRIEAAKASENLAKRQLEAEEKKLSIGTSTSHNVLELQEDYITAKLNYLKAVIDYNIAIANLERIQGTLLNSFDIEIEN